MAITIKDDVIYAMDSVGDLYTLNEVSGFSTVIATGVLPGVTGMDTSPATVMVPVDNNGDVPSAASGDAASTGSLSAMLLAVIAALSLLRRRLVN